MRQGHVHGSTHLLASPAESILTSRIKSVWICFVFGWFLLNLHLVSVLKETTEKPLTRIFLDVRYCSTHFSGIYADLYLLRICFSVSVLTPRQYLNLC